jgi:hypothetical protein
MKYYSYLEILFSNVIIVFSVNKHLNNFSHFFD